MSSKLSELTSFSRSLRLYVLASKKSYDFLLGNMGVDVQKKQCLEFKVDKIRLKVVVLILLAVHKLMIVACDFCYLYVLHKSVY